MIIRNTAKRIEKTLYRSSTPVMKYEISYPEFTSEPYDSFVSKLNRLYYLQANRYAVFFESQLYKDAVNDYESSVQNNYPFRMHDATVIYDVTQETNGIVSLYFDMGIYSGGANGTDERTSDNWNVFESRRIVLDNFYPSGSMYKPALLEQIEKQVEYEIENNEGNFFEDYKKLIAEYFNPLNFYTDEANLIVFYNEITIAPHSSGIVEIRIPLTQQPARFYNTKL